MNDEQSEAKKSAAGTSLPLPSTATAATASSSTLPNVAGMSSTASPAMPLLDDQVAISRAMGDRLDGHPTWKGPRKRSRSPRREREEYYQTLESLEMENRAELAEAFLTGRATRKEIQLQDLNKTDRALYDKAIEKEWNSWMHFDAVEKLTEDQKRLFLKSGGKAVGTRWVFTDKNDLLRANDPTLGISAKARLVVQGCQERSSNIRSDSPTASLLAFHLLCSYVSTMQWLMRKADASNAYLQAGGIDRILVLRAPYPAPPGIGHGDLLRAKGSIYGTRDAGRAFWLHLLAILKTAGWRESALESAMFYFVLDDKLCGIMITHVDDLLYGYDESCKEVARSAKEISDKVKLTTDRTPFVYCGKKIEQDDDGTIKVSMPEATRALAPAHISRARRADPEAPLTAEEVSELRSGFGSLGWIARQLRADIAVTVSLGQQATADPRVKHLLMMNKCIEKCREDPEFTLRFRHSLIDWTNCAVWAVADASFGNVDAPELGVLGEKVKSQAGFVLGLCAGPLTEAMQDTIHVLEWGSSSIKRVVKSTLSAEAYGVVDAAEAAEWLGVVVAETRCPTEAVLELEKSRSMPPLVWFTDSDSLYKLLRKDCGKPADKRVRIVMAQLKQMMNDGASLHWLDTLVNIADPLTKEGLDTSLLKLAMTDGLFDPTATKEAISKKVQQRADRARRKDEKKRGQLKTS